jgi:hypothetical protein
MRLSVRSTTVHTARDIGHCRRTVAAARPEHVRFSLTAVSAQYTDTVSTTPTVQLCASTVGFDDPPPPLLLLFDRTTDTLVSKYGTVVAVSDPLLYSFFTSTVTTLDTSCGDGSATVALLFDKPLPPDDPNDANRDASTSTVVTTTATAPPVRLDGSVRATVVLLSGNATAYDAAVPLCVPLLGRTTASASFRPSAVTDVTVPLEAVPLATNDRNASWVAVLTAKPGLVDGRAVGAIDGTDETVGCAVAARRRVGALEGCLVGRTVGWFEGGDDG